MPGSVRRAGGRWRAAATGRVVGRVVGPADFAGGAGLVEAGGRAGLMAALPAGLWGAGAGRRRARRGCGGTYVRPANWTP